MMRLRHFLSQIYGLMVVQLSELTDLGIMTGAVTLKIVTALRANPVKLPQNDIYTLRRL